jgi:hypothetical protein
VNSRRRINAALIGLIVLVMVTWLVQGELAHHRGAPEQPSPPAVTDTRR